MRLLAASVLALGLLSACQTRYPSVALDDIEVNHGELGGFDLTKPIWQN